VTQGRPPRLALFTLGSAASAGAVADFARAHAGQIVLASLSDPYRPGAGGVLGQALRHLRHSGPRMLGYLIVNMALPRLVSAMARGGERSLVALCRQAGIPMVIVQDVNGPAMHAQLRAARPDMIVSFHFDQIFTAETLALAPLGGINIHPGLLPRHRGPIPAFWAGMEPEPAYGVTIHRLVPRIDAGAILAQQAVALPAGTTASAAARLLHEEAVPLAGQAVMRIAAGDATEDVVRPLPYCPFPAAATLRQGRRRGVRLVDSGDIRAALSARL
jgi:folate-dependent phosphoribosylglycinamide formyltransferase PurN